ncbi:MAG: hypothetical protein V2I33_22215 [Kangiellaceae bacterium]|nr:hypothetical protein [Kangiellaceae bacterium]
MLKEEQEMDINAGGTEKRIEEKNGQMFNGEECAVYLCAQKL